MEGEEEEGCLYLSTPLSQQNPKSGVLEEEEGKKKKKKKEKEEEKEEEEEGEERGEGWAGERKEEERRDGEFVGVIRD